MLLVETLQHHPTQYLYLTLQTIVNDLKIHSGQRLQVQF